MVYTVEEVRLMFKENHLLLLEALKDGIVLWAEDTIWDTLKKEFNTKLAAGKLIPRKREWTINP